MVLNSVFQKGAGVEPGIFNLQGSGSKLDVVLDMIEKDYVDTVSSGELVEKAIPAILKDLDPHTVYIPAKDLQRVNEDLKGNFGGIGVQFIRYQDTVCHCARYSWRPRQKLAGIKAGDRIVMVDDSLVAGVKMSDNDIIDRLKGPKGTPV